MNNAGCAGTSRRVRAKRSHMKIVMAEKSLKIVSFKGEKPDFFVYSKITFFATFPARKSIDLGTFYTIFPRF